MSKILITLSFSVSVWGVQTMVIMTVVGQSPASRNWLLEMGKSEPRMDLLENMYTVYIYIYICTCMYIYICVIFNIYIYIYIFICKNHSAFLIIEQAGLDSPAGISFLQLNILEIPGIPRGSHPLWWEKTKLPSGSLTVRHGKIHPFLIGKPSISMGDVPWLC